MSIDACETRSVQGLQALKSAGGQAQAFERMSGEIEEQDRRDTERAESTANDKAA